ncbi:protein FAM171B-like isoform 2-T2 [Odontesthes bonariensis]
MKSDPQDTSIVNSLKVMRLLRGCLFCALVLSTNGETTAELSPAAEQLLHNDDRNFAKQDHVKQELFQHPQKAHSTSNLRVHVNDMMSHQRLSQAVVEVFINYTKNNSALSGEDGSALLHVPYHSGLPVTIVASKVGYMPTVLPCKTNRIPIFSSVMMSLLNLKQGNIWLFEDSVLITGQTADVTSQPTVRFPKSLLNLTHSSNITSVKAYLTIPKLTSDDQSSLNTLGIMNITSDKGYVSVDLSPVAAVSVQLFSGDAELHMSGPIHFTLTVPDSWGLHSSNVIPAWYFNRSTGGWMRKGLGKVMSVDGKLVWTFTAPHLGYWMAAPLSSTRGFFDLAFSIDFISHHYFALMVLFGGALVAAICLLVGLLFYCRRGASEIKARKMQHVLKRDQTTSMCDDEVFEASSGSACDPGQNQNHSLTERGDNQRNASFIRVHNSEVIVNPGAVAIALECNELEINTDLTDLTFSHSSSEQARLPASLTDNLFFFNQPVAIFPAPAFFQLEEPEPTQWGKSATLPRAGASNGASTEPLAKDSIIQTLPKGPPATQSQAETEKQFEVLEGSQAANSVNTSRGPFGLLESASVPGTLNKIRESRHSMHTLTGLSEIPSPQPPRAWFVSLEGKPAAEIRYTVSEQQRRRRPIESRDTSLDSGVDMSELNQMSGRRAVTLERNATFVKSKQEPRE